jgi:MOSC domain-containing protein YiiM
MIECDPNSSVPDWVIEHPETLAIFQELGIDYCCGGKSLEFACRERGLDPVLVLSRIRRKIEVGNPSSVTAAVMASIQVGLLRQLGDDGAADPMDRTWTTGFFKQPAPGPVRLGKTNLDGDQQADIVHHGGPDKAVLAYSADHYDDWRLTLNNPALPFGAFGENFTIQGLTEAVVCIGDIWMVGDVATVQVSQPRQPCWKLDRRWRIKTLALQVQRTGRTGWYFRVLTEGIVTAGMPLVLLERPYPDWSVERANRVMHIDKDDRSTTADLAAIPLLAASWRTTLARRAERNVRPDPTKRLLGQNES